MAPKKKEEPKPAAAAAAAPPKPPEPEPPKTPAFDPATITVKRKDKQQHQAMEGISGLFSHVGGMSNTTHLKHIYHHLNC